MFVGVLAVLSFLYWFMFRFMVGLPGVALGHTPDFFKDLWPLSKGETWGLPLRVIVSTIIIYIPILIFMGLALMPTIKTMIANPVFEQTNNDPTVMFPIIADMMDSMSYVILASTIFMVPFMWYITLLLAIAFQRFRERQSQIKAQVSAK